MEGFIFVIVAVGIIFICVKLSGIWDTPNPKTFSSDNTRIDIILKTLYQLTFDQKIVWEGERYRTERFRAGYLFNGELLKIEVFVGDIREKQISFHGSGFHEDILYELLLLIYEQTELTRIDKLSQDLIQLKETDK